MFFSKNKKPCSSWTITIKTTKPFIEAQKELCHMAQRHPRKLIRLVYYTNGKKLEMLSTDYKEQSEMAHTTILLKWIKDHFAPTTKVPHNITWFHRFFDKEELQGLLYNPIEQLFQLCPESPREKIEYLLVEIEKAYMEIMFTSLPQMTNLPSEERPYEDIAEWSKHLVSFATDIKYNEN